MGVDVIGTDGDMDAIRLARKAIPSNKQMVRRTCVQEDDSSATTGTDKSTTAADAAGTGRVQFQQFWWGRDDVTRLGDGDFEYVPDVVIACAVMYEDRKSTRLNS